MAAVAMGVPTKSARNTCTPESSTLQNIFDARISGRPDELRQFLEGSLKGWKNSPTASRPAHIATLVIAC
jgi:hypothetical protein